ncbi:MAG TPA: bifunctional adenosylcobinamide kinase/adenosylcobinamide-phosphate guanylyltransferase [Methylomirabilota bacterium]|nr:bifunctional adenosylcobinamide kinase/adenosylcobinamide-phosphate guanylyltransferase [Methylomirabilota bacterium]
MSARLTFVLGGARSGKSRHAEHLVRSAGDAPWTYIATAQAFDTEMAERIARHRAGRGEGWRTVDAPHDLAGAIGEAQALGAPILVDCLTLWLSNRLLSGAALDSECDLLVDALGGGPSPVVAVSNEVGLGIVPDNVLSRQFRDAAGRLHQSVAERADRVILVVAGLPLTVKG